MPTWLSIVIGFIAYAVVAIAYYIFIQFLRTKSEDFEDLMEDGDGIGEGFILHLGSLLWPVALICWIAVTILIIVIGTIFGLGSYISKKMGFKKED